MNKYFFRVGTTDLMIEYRATLAWELLRSQGPGLLMKEAIQEHSEAASDLVDRAFSLADAFVDKVEYREAFKQCEVKFDNYGKPLFDKVFNG